MEDVLPGETVAFSVQAAGTEPLDYKWQWKQFGKEGEKDGWQKLSGEGSTFQVMKVTAHDAGYYQCHMWSPTLLEVKLHRVPASLLVRI